MKYGAAIMMMNRIDTYENIDCNSSAHSKLHSEEQGTQRVMAYVKGRGKQSTR